jgi:hypothetical protein
LQEQHSFEGWLADMLSWGRYTEIDEDEDELSSGGQQR